MLIAVETNWASDAAPQIPGLYLAALKLEHKFLLTRSWRDFAQLRFHPPLLSGVEVSMQH